MNTDKLAEIKDSYYNGQKKQMVEQIKAYSIKAFMLDFFTLCKEGDYPYSENLYADIVYTFFLLKD